MFTGIVQAVGRVRGFTGSRLSVELPDGFASAGFEEGESIAVNGCCLTVIASGTEMSFDLSPETLARTAIGSLPEGALVNLERAARIDSFLGGHIVQGHVDCTGTVESITPVEGAWIYRFRAPREYDRYLIDKGSVTVEGISLTVVEPRDGAFDTWIIPHTLEHTNLKGLTVGSSVNLEFDVLAKHVEKLLAARIVAA